MAPFHHHEFSMTETVTNDTLIDFLAFARAQESAFTFREGGSSPECAVFSRKSFFALLSNPLLGPDWIRVAHGGQPLDLTQELVWKVVQKKRLVLLPKTHLSDVLKRGGAVVLEGIDLLDEQVARLCREIDSCLPCSLVNCEAFYSQLDSEAYPGHRDSDDVLVIQLHGEKKWRIHAPQRRRYIGNGPLSDDEMGPLLTEILLRPGDILFVRAGVPHRCITTGPESLHLSFDICDRTLNIEQITSLANHRHNSQLSTMFAKPTEVLADYALVLRDRTFIEELEDAQSNVQASVRSFRESIVTSLEAGAEIKSL